MFYRVWTIKSGIGRNLDTKNYLNTQNDVIVYSSSVNKNMNLKFSRDIFRMSEYLK